MSKLHEAARQANLDCVAHFEVVKAERDELLEALREAEYALDYASDMTKPEGLSGCDCPHLCVRKGAGSHSQSPRRNTMSENTFKAYSLNDEDYHFESVDELFAAMDEDGELVVGRIYYEADFRRFVPNDFTGKYSVARILEQFDEDLYEEIGDISDGDFKGVTDEAADELAKLLAGWIEKNVNVGRYWKIVGKAREMKVAPDDIKEGCAP